MIAHAQNLPLRLLRRNNLKRLDLTFTGLATERQSDLPSILREHGHAKAGKAAEEGIEAFAVLSRELEVRPATPTMSANFRPSGSTQRPATATSWRMPPTLTSPLILADCGPWRKLAWLARSLTPMRSTASPACGEQAAEPFNRQAAAAGRLRP